MELYSFTVYYYFGASMTTDGSNSSHLDVFGPFK